MQEETRIQTINGDTVLEVVTNGVTKVRHSEKRLKARKAYLEQSIITFQRELEEVTPLLILIEHEKETAT